MKKKISSLLKKAGNRKACKAAFALLFLPLITMAQHMELEQARQLAIAKQHQAAETELTKLVEEYPDFLPAKLLRAHNYSWWRQFDLSVAEFKAILKEYPDNEDALVGLGYAYVWSGDTPKALFPFQKALQKNRDSEEARKGLGHSYLVSGNAQAAEAVFRGLVEDFPNNPEYFIGKGQAHILLDETRNARRAFQKVLALEPNNRLGQELLNRTRTESSVIELDAWGGYSEVGNDSRYGMRFLQGSWQFNPRFMAYVKYDNSLSLDNIDFVTRRQGVPSAWVGSFAGWNARTASRLEYGLRFFPDRNTQHLFKGEQVFYTRNAVNFKVGGFMGTSSDAPTEWFVNTGFNVPVGKLFSVETAYFYSRDGNSDEAQHRGLLAGKVRHPKGYELTIGGFYGKPNLNTELLDDARDHITGAYLIGLFPFSKIVWGQFAINRENGVFDNSTVFAVGVKIRMEK